MKNKTALSEQAFRVKLKAELGHLKRIFEKAHAHGLTMKLQEEYMTLRFWFNIHAAEVNLVLAKPDEPRNGIATWSLAGRSADQLFRLIGSPSLDVDMGTNPARWRPALSGLMKEAGGVEGKTETCAPTRPKKSKRAPASGPVLLLADVK